MKIVQILPGSGGTFYCENCMRDSTLARALIDSGHDVTLMPMYLPIYTDDASLTQDTPIFFGGINAYLQQKLAVFRHTPRWLDRLFDARWLLGLAAKRAGATRAASLGDMTWSMLRGTEGNQAKEVDRMLTWLEQQGLPDVVHVSSTLLLGLAPELRRRLAVPLVYNSMDEDTWLDALPQPWQDRCWSLMREQVHNVDALVCPTRQYGERMAARLDVSRNRLHIIPIGIDIRGYARETPPAEPTLGFLSRMCPSLGLDVLVEAFIRLRRETPELRNLRLRAMGGETGDDHRFVRRLRKRLTAAGLADDAEFLPQVDRRSRLDFLKSLSVLSVPMPGGEAFGTFILESLAVGVPVVQPDAGGFGEVIRDTGGGLLYAPGDAEALVAALRSLLLDPAKAAEMGNAGRQRVQEHYTVQTISQRTLDLYRALQGRQR